MARHNTLREGRLALVAGALDAGLARLTRVAEVPGHRARLLRVEEGVRGFDITVVPQHWTRCVQADHGLTRSVDVIDAKEEHSTRLRERNSTASSNTFDPRIFSRWMAVLS